MKRNQSAFTFVELVVVIGVLALLAVTALPALSRSKPNNRALQCMGNMRALVAAWQMYAQDNNDRLVTQLHGGSTAGGIGDPTYGAPWATGWLEWTVRPDVTNVALLVSQRYAKLASYTRDPAIYRCPSDTYLSAQQASYGWARRARSYAGNIYVGEGNAENGPWAQIYKHVFKTTDMLYPAPSDVWVFLQEHPDSINDPAFFSPNQNTWIDLPAPLHHGSTPFAMADGHVEMHKWQASLTRGPAVSVRYSFSPITSPTGDPDIHWISYHTPRNSAFSY